MSTITTDPLASLRQPLHVTAPIYDSDASISQDANISSSASYRGYNRSRLCSSCPLWVLISSTILMLMLLGIIIAVSISQPSSSSSPPLYSEAAPFIPSPSPSSSSLSPGTTGTIVNSVPRTDITGTIMDCHDGNILLVNGTYYLYGASYGFCREPDGANGCSQGFGYCGFYYNHNVSLWTSSDLVNWTPGPVQPVFQMAKHFTVVACLFEPKVIYNAHTQLWLLWFNYYGPGLSDSYIGIMSSPTPYGPFSTIVTTSVDSLTYKYGYDDFDFVVDDNPSHDAWILYNAHNAQGIQVISVEQLNDDYTGGRGGAQYNSGNINPYYLVPNRMGEGEAFSFWYINGVYYASWGTDCCYCEGGATSIISTAKHPLGPWTYGVTYISSAIPAQQNGGLVYFDADGNQHYMWRGDMWQSAPDRIKAHDILYMGVVEFDANGIPQQVVFLDSYNISVGTGPVGYRLAASTTAAEAAATTTTTHPLSSSSPLSFSTSSSSAVTNCSAIVNASLPLGWIQPGALYTFATDALSPTKDYLYNPNVTQQQPWTFTANPPAGGLALTNSPFDPAPPIATPSNCSTYAFIQTSSLTTLSQMSATLTGLQVGRNYSLSFYYGVRAGPTQGQLGGQANGALSESQLTIYVDKLQVWQSRKNLLDSGGWVPIHTPSFIATMQTGSLLFSVMATSQDDHSVIITDLLIQTA